MGKLIRRVVPAVLVGGVVAGGYYGQVNQWQITSKRTKRLASARCQSFFNFI